jgi:N-acetylmuramoyl-L-alanine amidase
LTFASPSFAKPRFRKPSATRPRLHSPLATCLLAIATVPGLAQTSTAPATPPATPPSHKAPATRPLIVLHDAKPVADFAKPAPKPASAATPTKPVATPATKPAATPAAKPVAKPATRPAVPLPAATVATSPQLPPIPFNRAIILLDPGHGGVDSGSHISDAILEKDVTLTLAFRLRSLLTARGLSVVMTRDSDAATAPNTPNALTLDDRAGIANHAHPVACLLLHATAAGNGVHLYSSELDPTPGEPLANPWLTAQAPWVTQSQRLQKQLALALTRANVPLVLSRASVRPVDSLTCPALVVELAPEGTDLSSLTDADYQQRVAEAIATALVFWKNQAQPPDRLAATPAATSFTPAVQP